MAARGIECAFRMLEGRWKMVIIFHLFARGILRFSELEKAIPGVSQKMLIQQLRELERDGIVTRTVHPQVPPKVEYALTKWGQAMCPALDELLEWAALRPKPPGRGNTNARRHTQVTGPSRAELHPDNAALSGLNAMRRSRSSSGG